jgi:hypothetical protein
MEQAQKGLGAEVWRNSGGVDRLPKSMPGKNGPRGYFQIEPRLMAELHGLD